jgi:predicted nucleic acid-binding protein
MRLQRHRSTRNSEHDYVIRMIVYFESNFVFEVAFQRGDHLAAGELLNLAKERKIELVIPAYSIGEPYEGMTRRSKDRSQLHNRLEQELRELARSQPYANVREISNEVTAMLIASAAEEKRRLDETLSSILDCADVVPLNRAVFQLALSRRGEFNLAPQDAFVLASVEFHARSRTGTDKLFLTTNSADFLNSELEAHLLDCQCKLMTKFGNGLAYVRGS